MATKEGVEEIKQLLNVVSKIVLDVQKQTKRDTHYLIHVHEISLLNHATATKLQYVHVHVRTSSKCVLQYEMCTCCIQSLWKRHRYMHCLLGVRQAVLTWRLRSCCRCPLAAS